MMTFDDIKAAAKKVKKDKKTIDLGDAFIAWSKALQKVVIIPKDSIE
jgi:hypothetical protein